MCMRLKNWDKGEVHRKIEEKLGEPSPLFQCLSRVHMNFRF